MNSITSYSSPLTTENAAFNKQLNQTKQNTSQVQADNNAKVLEKFANSNNRNQPVSPAAVISLSPTNIILSSGGNLYQSDVFWHNI